MPDTRPCPQCGRPELVRPAPDSGLCDPCLAGPLTHPVPKTLAPGRRALAERWQHLPRWGIGRWCSNLPRTLQDARLDYAVDGLLQAARLWNPDFGVKFNTYAATCIKRRFWQAYRDEMEGQKLVLLPLEFDTPAVSPAADDAGDRAAVAMLLDHITSKRRRLAVELRYGVGCGNGEPMTLDEIGGLMGLSKERIRQLTVAGVKEMRAAAGVQRAAG